MSLRNALIVVFAMSLAGCAVPTPPPTMSASRLVHPTDGQGRVGFSTGLAATIDDDETMSVQAFPSEAGLGLTLGERYDLGVSVGNLMGNLEGNVILIDSGFKLGFLHGAGFGLLASQGGGTMLTNFGGGALFQTSGPRPFFAAAKYTYSTAVGDTEGWAPTSYLTGTLGFMPSGHPRVIPEMAINYGTNDDGWFASLIIGVTVMADF